MQLELSFRVALHTCAFVVEERQAVVNSDVAPDRVDEEPHQIESVAVDLLVFNKSLGVGLVFCKSTEGAHKVRRAQDSWLEVIGVDVLAEVDHSGDVFWVLPD